MKPLVIIPARGGSKGVPRKNIKLLNGKALILYAVEEARKVFKDEQICISTDDIEIKSCVENAGLKVPFLRPEELAMDHSSTYDVLRHAVGYYESIGYFADVVVLLQPTSPFRKARHIQEALQLFSNDLDMVVSVKETKANPYYVLFEENASGYLEKSKTGTFLSRQECPKVWEFNGSVYVIAVSSLKKGTISEFTKIMKYEMDEVSSLDIDEPLDWKIAEILMQTEEI